MDSLGKQSTSDHIMTHMVNYAPYSLVYGVRNQIFSLNNPQHPTTLKDWFDVLDVFKAQ